MRRGYSIRNNFSLSSWKRNHTVYIIRRKLRNLRETRWPHNWMAGLWVKKSTFQTELGDCDTHWGKTLLLVHHTPTESIIGYWWTVTKGWRNAWGGGGGRGLMVQNQTFQHAMCYYRTKTKPLLLPITSTPNVDKPTRFRGEYRVTAFDKWLIAITLIFDCLSVRRR